MRTFPGVLRRIRCICLIPLAVLALSCEGPSTSVPETDGDFIISKSIGAENVDVGQGVCVDSSGNVYITGSFQGIVDFDPGPGVVDLNSVGTTNAIFISKFNSSGDLVWAKAIGGATSCIGYGITVDASGNTFTTGFFWDTKDFDPGTATDNIGSAGQSDAFVLKLDSSGDYVWAKAMGGTQYESGLGIALDTSGDILLTGYFQGTADFDPDDVGVSNLISSGNLDIFIAKLDSAGDFVWAKGIGGGLEDRGYGIDTDSLGNVYTTGFFQEDVDFDPDDVDEFDLINASGYDIFVSKLDSDGDFVWAKGMGGTVGGEGNGIALDPLGNVYTTGYFAGTVDFDPGAGTSNLASNAGSQDIFVSKLDSDGDFVWSGAMGGGLSDIGYGISVDSSGNVYTTGLFQETGDFDPGAGTYDLTNVLSNDIFISKLNSSGNFVWAKALSGTASEVGYDVCSDSSSNVYATGSYQETVDFDPGPGTFNLSSSNDSTDIFVVYLDGP